MSTGKPDVGKEAAAIRDQGYVLIPDFLSPGQMSSIREALAPHLRREHLGRNNFEGHETERVYSLVGLGKLFEDLAEEPRIMALCDAFLEPNYLLTASQAICIHPGESPQAFHTDDAFYRIPRPRPAVSLSTIYAIDPFTAENGATQIVPGSHAWSDPELENILKAIDFETRGPEERRPRPPDPTIEGKIEGKVIDATMPAGSVIVFLGTFLHRGGANRSTAPRLALSNQYCQPWARQQENYLMSIPRERVRRMSPGVQSLLGYSIHPPFMGHVKGVHPRRLLEGGGTGREMK
ncbi:MAG: phytanoyl-CoA dioxygenase family protein [Deltaproteobacteria bacterium]|nr:phytanoyl-CoA dioxygenase family protein [Deltaproteobacteria bacterium]